MLSVKMMRIASGTFGDLSGLYGQQNRGFATLKDISIRLKSVKNIQKITKSMKMIAAVKYARAEKELKPARPYGEGAKAFYDRLEVAKDKHPDHLIIAISSDRGLCGAIHSSITRMIKADLKDQPDGGATRMVLVGDKSRQQLSRYFPKNVMMTVNEVGRKPPTFADASTLAQAILDSGFNFKQGDIYFNRFKSVVSYSTSKLPMYNKDTLVGQEKLNVYDSLDAEVVQSYYEYSLASLLYYAMKESACSEQSSRMTAMDAASKNAGEMIGKMTLLFNRTRQAVITKELIEIISGAAAI